MSSLIELNLTEVLLSNFDVELSNVSRKLLCRTLLGNKCEYLIVTSANNKKHKKQGLVITARVHPGETVGSWIMQGKDWVYI